MPASVFLSFHFERDSARALQISTAPGLAEACSFRGVITRLDRMALERQGSDRLRRWIDAEIGAANIAVILVGGGTWSSPSVHYAIQRCRAAGLPMIAVYIHRLADSHTGLRDSKGQNPLDLHYLTGSRPPVYLSQICRTFDWVTDQGEQNLPAWIAEAAAQGDHPKAPAPRPGRGLASSRHVSEDWDPKAFVAEP